MGARVQHKPKKKFNNNKKGVCVSAKILTTKEKQHKTYYFPFCLCNKVISDFKT
jgi:hypothetical protein